MVSAKNGSIEFSSYLLQKLILSLLIIILATCPPPVEQLGDSIWVKEYTEPALRGTLACPAVLTLTGHNTVTCMGNGEWEPDLSKWNARMKVLFKSEDC